VAATEQVGAFVVVQSQGASDRVKDVFGHAADVTLPQPRVPLRAHAGKDGDLLAPQPGDPATVYRAPLAP
jgi:hypothetical protein